MTPSQENGQGKTDESNQKIQTDETNARNKIEKFSFVEKLPLKNLRTFRKTRRSRSAPAGYGRKRERRRLLEQHYRIDHENRALLPGVPIQDEDFARDCHDFFNLIFLVPVIALNVMNWSWDKLLWNQGASGVEGAWHGDYFSFFWNFTVGYFLVDLLWVCIIPQCVKSPTTIIQHHIASILYLLIPFYWIEYRWCMGVCLSVELNTWFLIARRTFNKQGFPPWTIDLPYLFSVRVKLISVFFYITWVTTRIIIYPWMMIKYYTMYMKLSETATRFNILATILTMHSVFCVLNAKWTWDLFCSKVRQWKTKGQTKIEKGL